MTGSAVMMAAALATAPCAIALPHQGSAPSILRELAVKWQAEMPAIRFAEPFGPPQGALNPAFEAFLEGKSGFAFLTREISEADLATFRRHHGAPPLTIPVANGAWNTFGYVDAVAIIVNDLNPLRKLSFRQLDAILSESHFRSAAASEWGAVGVRAWRNRPIHLAGGGAWAGEESARALTIRRHVLNVGGRAGRWRQAPGSGSEAEVVDRVAADPLAIGFTGVGHVRGGVHMVAVSGDSGRAYLPTLQSIAAGRYPLSRSVDLLLPPQPQCADPTVSAFVRYLLAKGGQHLVQMTNKFRPLNGAELRRSIIQARVFVGRRQRTPDRNTRSLRQDAGDSPAARVGSPGR